jgi:hypothetical protein
MDEFWSALSAISTAVGALIVVIGGIYARSQVNEARLARNIALLTNFQRQYQTDELREFRDRLLKGKLGVPESFDPKALQQSDYYKFWMIFDQLEFLGILVDRKLIDFDLVMSTFHRSPPLVWDAVRPYVLKRRKVGRTLLGIHFERLAQRYNDEYQSYVNRLRID